MPHYLVELYTPNAAWRGLSPEHRQQFISGIQAAMGGLAGSGIELLTLAETDTAVDHTTSHRFWGSGAFLTHRPAMRCSPVSPPAAGMIILIILMPRQLPAVWKNISAR